MYDPYEEEYETDTEQPEDAGWWIPLAVIAGGYTLAVFTVGAIAGSVFG